MKNKIVLLIILLVLVPFAVAIAEVFLKAEVDKTSISTDEVIAYKLSITSGEQNLPQPQLPKFADFYIISQLESSSVSLGRGKIKNSSVYTFILAPKDAGKFKLEPAQIKIKGKIYSSEAFEIEVKQGKSKPQPPAEEKPSQPEEIPESREPQITL
jgi:hypothetical protein